jgi:hydroxymethylbilane synthase
MRIRIGTRNSALALWQARHVRDVLAAAHRGIELEIVEITSDGDHDLKTPLAQMGTVGIFTQTLERALLDERIDVAVHSLKDVPAQLAEGTEMVAYSEREDPRDAWFHRDGLRMAECAEDAKVATGSLRRRSQMLHQFPKLQMVELRGNLQTRWRKFEEGQFDAMILAAAGVRRLGWADRVTEFVPTDDLLPAVGQGIVGVQTRSGAEAMDYVKAFNNIDGEVAALAERSLLEAVAGGCVVPLAGFCERVDEKTLHLRAILARPDGSKLLRADVSGDEPVALGRAAGQALISQGGAEIVAAAKNAAQEGG